MRYRCERCGRDWDKDLAVENEFACTKKCGGRLVPVDMEESAGHMGPAGQPLRIFLGYDHDANEELVRRIRPRRRRFDVGSFAAPYPARTCPCQRLPQPLTEKQPHG